MSPVKKLIRSAEEGDLPAVRQLIADNPELVNATGDHSVTALHAAAEKNQAEAATILLDAGAELETETTWGMTPLQWAANMGSGEVGSLLISRGAHLNLWAAAGLGLVEEVRSFIDSPGQLKPGAEQKQHRQRIDGEWETIPAPSDFKEAISDAFYIACRNGRTEVASILLGHGASVDALGFFGGAALHWAAINGHAETVEFLKENGARLDLRDEQFQSTPAEWAKEGGHEELAARLK
jgi:uncharacterized protein